MFALIFAGCGEKPEPKNQWEDIKLEDLMPQGRPQQSEKAIVGLSVFFFQLDADKYQQVQNAMHNIDGLTINLQDTGNFNANGLICGGGDFDQWRKIAASFANTNTTIAKKITFFMDAGTTEIIETAKITESASVSYRTAENASAMIGLPEGSFVLKLSTQTLIGLKQACKLEIKPSYKTIAKKSNNKKVAGWEYAFDSANISATIRPGQFVFLAPQSSIIEDAEQAFPTDLGQRLFAVKDGKDVIKFCLIFCGLIND
ncbi:MAG: hypothetical protein A2Y10_11195 [Planctomycetes bacterium GWF2_41_51]|nr:MAG: hypothetical protein A2Y10_11195 [Planctomycetes bacterium GWF2_41_51]HBG28385.1 hypothetical protein [Phycisphaerales bacterium]